MTSCQQLEMSIKASQCRLFSPNTTLLSSADRQLQAAIKTEMVALLSTTGHCGRYLQQAFDCLMTIPVSNVLRSKQSILICRDFVLQATVVIGRKNCCWESVLS